MTSGVTARPLRVLVVEDDPAMARAIARRLVAVGVEVACVHDAESALRRLEAEAIDIVWSDLQLGDDQDGIDVLFQAANRWPEAMLLLVTGDTARASERTLPVGTRVFLKSHSEPAFLLVSEEKERLSKARLALTKCG